MPPKADFAITLNLSAAQVKRLRKIAKILEVDPQDFAVVSIFDYLDGHEGAGHTDDFLSAWKSALESYSKGTARRRSSVPSVEQGLRKAVSRRPKNAPAPQTESPASHSKQGLLDELCRFEGKSSYEDLSSAGQRATRQALFSIEALQPNLTAEMIAEYGKLYRLAYPTAPCDMRLLSQFWKNLGPKSLVPANARFGAIRYRPVWGPDNIPVAEFGPSVWLETPHNAASALQLASVHLRDSRKHEVLQGARSVLLTSTARVDQLRAETHKIYSSRYQSLWHATECLRGVEIGLLENWTHAGVVDTARSLVASLRPIDQLVVFSDRNEVLPHLPVADISKTFVSDVLDDAAVAYPDVRVDWVNPNGC